jgi:hypothetical protein
MSKSQRAAVEAAKTDEDVLNHRILRMMIREIPGEDNVSPGVNTGRGKGFALLSGDVILGELGERLRRLL